MVLPAGVNKATGPHGRSRELELSPHNVVGVGDAENDHAFLSSASARRPSPTRCPRCKDTADLVRAATHGAGVDELIDRAHRDRPGGDAVARCAATQCGVDQHGMPVMLEPYGDCILVCGASASGKSTLARRVVESLLERAYQFCLIDPEGDYEEQPGAVVIGKTDAEPRREEVLQLLEDYGVNGVVCMTGVPISDRPRYFAALLSDLLQLRGRYGRPHWIVIDEAHHLLPAEWEIPNGLLPEHLVNVLLVTVHPELLSAEMLKRVTKVIAVGPTAPELLRQFAARRGVRPTESALAQLAEPVEVGKVLLWSADDEPVDAWTSSRRARSTAATRASTPLASCRPTEVSISAAPKESSISGRKISCNSSRSRRGRRRHLALPFPARGLLALVPRCHQRS